MCYLMLQKACVIDLWPRDGESILHYPALCYRQFEGGRGIRGGAGGQSQMAILRCSAAGFTEGGGGHKPRRAGDL